MHVIWNNPPVELGSVAPSLVHICMSLCGWIGMYDYITEELQAFDKMPELQEEDDENHEEVMVISTDGAAESSTG